MEKEEYTLMPKEEYMKIRVNAHQFLSHSLTKD